MREKIQSLISGAGSALVVGLGITGIETALFLNRCGIRCTCIERAPREEYLERSKFKDRISELESRGIRIGFGIEGESVASALDGVALAVLSPGVSLESAIVGTLKRFQVQYVSELELGILLSGVPSIVVTGSNGKTTTVTLLHHLLTRSGIPSLLCGNVGTPILSALSPEDVTRGRSERFNYLVVEASSYQLESCALIKPKVGVLLNLSDNHLERHGSMSRYLDAKARLFGNQDAEDFAVLNGDDGWLEKLAPRLKSTQIWFGTGSDQGTPGQSASISYQPSAGIDEIVIDAGGRRARFLLGQSKLLGRHNRFDAAAALIAAMLAGAGVDGLQNALLSFEPLEHRLELCGEIEGITHINDSKSTTVAASVAAVEAVVEAFHSRSVILMIGGLAKAGSWDPLMKAIKTGGGRIKDVVCFGRDSKTLASHCAARGIKNRRAETLAEGVALARSIAKTGDIVVLSPGCASFDEFTDFEDRGRNFKRLVTGRAAA